MKLPISTKIYSNWVQSVLQAFRAKNEQKSFPKKTIHKPAYI